MGNFENRVRDVVEYKDVPPLSTKNNQVVFDDQSQLPPVSGGTITLDQDTGYVVDGTVDISETIEFDGGGTGIYGQNWPTDQLNYTGSGTLFTTNGDTEVFLKQLVVLASTGTVYDVSGTNTDRFICQDTAHVMCDDLGTIDGFRVPGFKLCDFTNFTSGIRYTGNPEKIYITTTPFRQASGASGTDSAIYFDPNFQTEFIQIDNSFFKQFNNNSDALNFDPNATLDEFGIVKGCIFDDSVQNFTLNFDETTVGWDFIANNGIPTSKEQIQISMTDNATATTISSTNTYTKIEGTSSADFQQRFNSPSDNEVQYDGIRPETLRVIVDMTTNASSNDTYVFALFKNDSLVDTSERKIDVGQRSNTINNVSINTYIDFNTDDNLDVRVKNEDSTSNITVEQMTLTVGE